MTSNSARFKDGTSPTLDLLRLYLDAYTKVFMKGTYSRLILSAAIVGAAVGAQAQTFIFLQSAGNAVQTSGGTSYAENVTTQIGGFGPLATLNYSLDFTAAGSGDYTGTGGEMDFAVQYNLSSIQISGNSESISGLWEYTGGTGTYVGQTGGGTVTLNLLVNPTDPTKAISGTTLSGELNAVPEPASFAFLGLGLVGILCRRKRS